MKPTPTPASGSKFSGGPNPKGFLVEISCATISCKVAFMRQIKSTGSAYFKAFGWIAGYDLDRATSKLSLRVMVSSLRVPRGLGSLGLHLNTTCCINTSY